MYRSSPAVALLASSDGERSAGKTSTPDPPQKHRETEAIIGCSLCDSTANVDSNVCGYRYIWALQVLVVVKIDAAPFSLRVSRLAVPDCF